MPVKKQLTRSDKIALGGFAVAILGVVASWLVVPEFRNRFHLDKTIQSQPAGTPAPAQIIPPVVAEVKRVPGLTANTIEDMRRRHQVSQLPEAASGKTLSEMPEHTMAFISPYELVSHYSHLFQEKDINAYGRDTDFEVHKMSSDDIQIVAIVTETEERVREGLVSGANLTIYSDAWNEASKVVSIPLNALDCSRNRQLTLYPRNAKKPAFVSAVDCRIR